MAHLLPTTVMFRNLPRAYGPRDLMREIALHADPLLLDFVFVPSNGTAHNMGYGFVNFLTLAALEVVQRNMVGKTWGLAATTRRVKMLPANVHGLAANIEIVEPKLGDNPDGQHDLLVFIGGRETPFGDAVRILKSGMLQEPGQVAPSPQGPYLSPQRQLPQLSAPQPRPDAGGLTHPPPARSPPTAGDAPPAYSGGDDPRAVGYESQPMAPNLEYRRQPVAGRRSLVTCFGGSGAAPAAPMSEAEQPQSKAEEAWGVGAPRQSSVWLGQPAPHAAETACAKDLVLRSAGYERAVRATTAQLAELLRRCRPARGP